VKVYTDIASVPKAERGISIGVFDGVHRGHQALLRQLLAESHRHGWRALVLTFTNHPQEILNPPPPPLLTTVEERVQRLSELGMDEVLVLPFTEALSRYSAERFCREVLVEALGCRLLVAGEDFALGHRREGTISRLRELGRQLGFQVVVAPTVCHEGQPISSSHIRQLLLNGQIERANELLSAPFRLTGIVVAGAGRGKALGFPTINLQMPAASCFPVTAFTRARRICRRAFGMLPFTSASARPSTRRRPSWKPTCWIFKASSLAAHPSPLTYLPSCARIGALRA
jgi:riboflavin kinase/FMN adenylyltransferase